LLNTHSALHKLQTRIHLELDRPIDCIRFRNMQDPHVVVITGASAGVGRATAQAFAQRGAKVALIARGKTGLTAAARDVEARGGTALAIAADVSDHQAIDAAADRVERELGPIDVWINNAMVSEYASVWDMTPEEFKHIVDVTLLG
jgi:NAD(P)-dependent dehydrogenase (short-subunit alcohol dehydrogenase family)